MPAPLHLLDAKPYTCGCGRTWGCVEMYTTLAGLPYLLEEALHRYPDHELTKSTTTLRQKALALRGLAQKGDPLAVEIFDFQARALGLHVASLAMAQGALWRGKRGGAPLAHSRPLPMPVHANPARGQGPLGAEDADNFFP